MAAKEKKEMSCLDFQQFVETQCQQACKPVDLFRVARQVANMPAGPWAPDRLRLVLDAESCLHRLYGGYYSDWVCGGQWNRVFNFVRLLVNACQGGKIELVVFFNGALELQRIKQWQASQDQQRKNTAHIFKHIQKKGTPPPKVWWTSPTFLRTALRLAFRQIGVTVACSIDDHHQEVMAYCRENNFHGILADGSDYAVFDPAHFFSAQHLKLTYKGALETVEYVIEEVAKVIDLPPKRLCLLAALLGSHILPFDEFKTALGKILSTVLDVDISKMAHHDVVRNIAAYIRTLELPDDVETVAEALFRDCEGNAEKVARFKDSVLYFVKGTQDGFMQLRFSRTAHSTRKQTGSNPSPVKDEVKVTSPTSAPTAAADQMKGENESVKEEEVLVDTTEDHSSPYSSSGYASASAGSSQPPDIVVDPPTPGVGPPTDDDNVAETGGSSDAAAAADVADALKDTHLHDTAADTPYSAAGGLDAKKKAGATSTGVTSRPQGGKRMKVSGEVMKVAMDRHQKGLLSPLIYQLLVHSEVKVESCLEEEGQDLPHAAVVYRPIRQHVYALLFDLNKQRASWKTAQKEAKEKNTALPERPDVFIREWVSAPGGEMVETVAAEPISWLAPGLHRLWLGQAPEDKDKRVNAFLACLHCYDTPLMLNTSHVPPHLLPLCCVLRYLLICGPPRILRRHELDAFLATAVSPVLQDVDFIQELKLPVITARGVQLAALVMRGVEHALLANDVCGQPVPWKATCPGAYFDGKLFHFKLLKAVNGASLLDLCDEQMDQVVKVEHLRAAVLQKLIPEDVFARPPLPIMPPGPQWGGGLPYHDAPFRPPAPMYGGPGPMGDHHGALRGMRPARGAFSGHGPIDGRGGQLQIAGVVVGSWGANTHVQQQQGAAGRGRGSHVATPPQVLSVGMSRRGGPRGGATAAAGGLAAKRGGRGARGGRQDYSTRARGDASMQFGVTGSMGRGIGDTSLPMGLSMAGGLPIADFFAASAHSHMKTTRETRRVGNHGSPVSVSILDARYDDTPLPSHALHAHHTVPLDPFAAMSPYTVPPIGVPDHRHHHHHMFSAAARPNGFTHLR